MDSKTASDLVGKIIDWYWSCGVERKEYTIHPSGLYTLRLIRERQHAIAMAANGKPCVAFWGPSQSGKSSLLSHYVDGLDPEGKGKDSALAWGEKIRFSADKNAPENENLLVFNPKNGRNDATGLVTRFYLPASERDVDERCPVTIVPTTRRQILQSLAIGYRKECKSAQRPKRTVADLHHELDDSNGFMRRPNREAFELVCDFCEVCKTLSGTDSRFSCFADDSFLNRIVASRYAESIEVAWALVADMLWDGKDALTSLARDMFRFAESNLSQRKVIRASMAAACVLVDIDSLRKYDDRDRLCLVDKGDELVIDVGEGHPLSQDLFGLLHACIEELQVPLKKIADNPFYDFLKKTDLLDIPGVTNHSTGDDIKDLLIDLDVEADDLRREILARVTKTGKTLSVIYGQAANCAIDSCVIFVPLRREGGLSRPQVFVDGVAAWLAPYGLGKDFEWRSRPPLNLYVNLSLFGEIAEELAGQRGGLGGWTDLKLRFANKDCVDFFFTSNKFHPCKLQEWQKAKIEDDDEFSAAFLSGGGRDSLRALFSDPEGIGSDYMFNCLSSITADKRKQLYSSILKADVDMVLSVIAEARPEDVGERERRQEDILRAIAVRLEDALSGGTPAEEKKRMVTFLKRVLMLNPADLTPLMIRPKKCPDEEVGDYLRRQFQKWVADRASEISGDTLAGELLESPAADGQLFLEALACCSEKDTIAGFKELFGFVSDDEDAASARYPLATMMVNVLMCGSILNNVQYDVAVDDPVNISSEDMLIAPMYSRVCRLLDGGLNPNRRPHLFGDEEIDDLARTLAQN